MRKRAAYPLAKLGTKALANFMKRKANTQKQRTSSKKRKLAVKSMPRYRIGTDNGLIVSNHRVPRPPKGCAMYRRSVLVWSNLRISCGSVVLPLGKNPHISALLLMLCCTTISLKWVICVLATLKLLAIRLCLYRTRFLMLAMLRVHW